MRRLAGLHHLTAITANAPENVRFYTETLGMRMVKKTVNQDDVTAYHLFYADKLGTAGTDVTFFDWPYAAKARHGHGLISSTALRIDSDASLAYWTGRLGEHGIEFTGPFDRFGSQAIAFMDTEGQPLELVVDHGKDGGEPWEQSPVPAEHQIKGLHSVRLTVEEKDPLGMVLTQILGMTEAGSYEYGPEKIDTLVYSMIDGGAGNEVHIEVRPELERGRPGRGGVHHVAFRVEDDSEHPDWTQQTRQFGLRSTDVIDRFYFRSIYFQVPGGILFEIATDQPGFAADEPLEALGEKLALPPFLEPNRAEIESNLKPL
ncbi:MAG: ring-cleaving dioxygenase [Sphaerobacteraceae bacterium]|nr:MAG: ring-cleaving dioxygenase [Sphaerobacteraceae bacterium]